MAKKRKLPPEPKPEQLEGALEHCTGCGKMLDEYEAGTGYCDECTSHMEM
jgi:hypothetical protein